VLSGMVYLQVAIGESGRYVGLYCQLHDAKRLS